MRMHGTKHANDATAKRLNRQLRQLLDDPDSYLPEMTWKGQVELGPARSCNENASEFEENCR